jgi:hypothetical protein
LRHWNRDVNSSLNIYRILQQIILGNERPVYLRRPAHANALNTPNQMDSTVTEV